LFAGAAILAAFADLLGVLVRTLPHVMLAGVIALGGVWLINHLDNSLVRMPTWLRPSQVIRLKIRSDQAWESLRRARENSNQYRTLALASIKAPLSRYNRLLQREPQLSFAALATPLFQIALQRGNGCIESRFRKGVEQLL
jgi:hypothetical protein